MFTGIIEAQGKLLGIEKTSAGHRLRVELSAISEPGTRNPELAKLGDSIAVSGPCLTVSALEGSIATFDVVAETAARTTIPTWRAGRVVNLERSVPAGGRMGGHFVTGHIDGRARLLALKKVGESMEIDFAIPSGCEKLVAEKGSVTLDGTSLTVARMLSESSFRVALVPHTLGETTLSTLKPGDEINFEADILARYAARLMGAGGGLTEDKLRQAGFM
jgi:riboflavin synthase